MKTRLLLLVGIVIAFICAVPVFAEKEDTGTVFKTKCKCCDKCNCVQSCKCGGKCDCCDKCECKDKCMCLGNCKCCKSCKCAPVCSCANKCDCCKNCPCVKKRTNDYEAYPAGKNSYIIVGKAQKDGPDYKIALRDGKTITVTATSGTEFYPYWIKPENLPKVIVKYTQRTGKLLQADQIVDAKSGALDRQPSAGKMIYVIKKKELKEKK